MSVTSPRDYDLCIHCARAMVSIDKELMGISKNTVLQNILTAAGMETPALCDMPADAVEILFLTTYAKIAREHPEIIADFMKQRLSDDMKETLLCRISYEHVPDINESAVYKALSCILTYLKEKNQSPDIIAETEGFLKELSSRINKYEYGGFPL